MPTEITNKDILLELLRSISFNIQRIADNLEQRVRLVPADELPESQALERKTEIFPKKKSSLEIVHDALEKAPEKKESPVILKDGNKFVAEIEIETEKAYLFQQGILQTWVPKKAVESYKDGVVLLMDWFVKKGTLEWKPEKLKDKKKEVEKK